MYQNYLKYIKKIKLKFFFQKTRQRVAKDAQNIPIRKLSRDGVKCIALP